MEHEDVLVHPALVLDLAPVDVPALGLVVLHVQRAAVAPSPSPVQSLSQWRNLVPDHVLVQSK